MKIFDKFSEGTITVGNVSLIPDGVSFDKQSDSIFDNPETIQVWLDDNEHKVEQIGEINENGVYWEAGDRNKYNLSDEEEIFLDLVEHVFEETCDYVNQANKYDNEFLDVNEYLSEQEIKIMLAQEGWFIPAKITPSSLQQQFN